MKKITYLLTIAALALQSCSHVAVYREAEYQNGDATYPNETLQFAYPANGDSVSSSIAKIADRIHQKVTADSKYNTYLASAVEFVNVREKRSVDSLRHTDLEKAMAESERACKESATDSTTAEPVEASADETLTKKEMVEELTKRVNALSAFSPNDFKYYWQRIYQLSHRGIIQHYMSADADYRGLSATNKALVYGDILKKDIPGCEKLAESDVNRESEAFNSVRRKLLGKIASTKSELKEIERRKKAEEERLRRQREAEERARRRAAEAEWEREKQRLAQQRWADDSWLDGRWNLTGDVSGWAATVCIDTRSKTVRQYTRRLGDFSYPKPDYSGRYTISTGTNNGVRCKVIDYGYTRLIAYPDTGTLYDLDGYRFSGPH